VTFATYIVYLDKSGLSKMNPFKYGFYNSLVCSILVLGYALATGTFAYRLTPLAWGLLLFFSITITVIAVVCFQLGVRMIGSQNTAILSTFEPLTSIFWGIVVFQDQFNVRTILGTVLILFLFYCSPSLRDV
jgi:drug/metabolite transporter (DMT)-like permease